MDKMKKWLEEQIDACEKLLAIEEKQGNDSTKIAEFFFSKLAYQVALEKLISIQHFSSGGEVGSSVSSEFKLTAMTIKATFDGGENVEFVVEGHDEIKMTATSRRGMEAIESYEGKQIGHLADPDKDELLLHIHGARMKLLDNRR